MDKILNLKESIINVVRNKNNNNETSSKKINFVKEWVIPIGLAILIAVFMNKYVFFNIVVPSSSMVPTLNINDRFVVTRVHNKENLKEGDIVVFHSDEYNQRLVKRLIGLPGDNIEIKNGVVFRNGEQLNEDYVKDKGTYTGKFQVPKGKYFFLGDNRTNSADSRRWKNPYIDASDIEGKVQFRFYPLKDFGTVK